MGILETITQGKHFSIEVVPPSRGGGLEELFSVIDGIMPFGPAFTSVTDHPGGIAYEDTDNGPIPVSLRVKPGTLGTCLAIRDRFGVETVPHIVATGTDKFTVEDLLIDLHYAGFRDIFAIRGDERYSSIHPRKSHMHEEGYSSAADLVAHIAALNRGEYSPPAKHGQPTSFRVGVAGYPGKHYAAPNPEADMRQLVNKINAGASFVITQMIFEASQYFDFIKRLQNQYNINIPVIPGIKPIVRLAQAKMIPRCFFIDIPNKLLCDLENARTSEEERKIGLSWTINLVKTLLDGGVPAVHFFTMGKGTATHDVLREIF